MGVDRGGSVIDFGFDLAGRRDARLARGAVVSGLGAVVETLPLAITCFVLDALVAGRADASWLPWVIVALVASVALGTVLKAIGGVYSFEATYSLVCDARLNLVDHLRRLPMGFWNDQQTGRVGSVITDEFAVYTEIVTHTWSLAVANLARPVALALLIMGIDWRLGLAAVATLPLAALSVPVSHRLLNRASDRLAATKGRAHARLVEFTQGAPTLREYDQAGVFHDKLENVLTELEREQMNTELAPAPALFAYDLLVWVGFSLVLAVGAVGVRGQWVSPVAVLWVALLTLQLYGSAAELSTHLALARFASRTLERIRALFEEPVQPEGERSGLGSSEPIHIDGVSFRYRDEPALSDVDATLEPGTLTALVGPSGSGKSTLAHLVSRLWDVDSGSIRIGNVDLRDVPLAELRKHVATVLQDVVLFRETVEDNIRLGCPEATRSQVVAAAQAARAHDFILELPDGYSTLLGEGGADLSGGQRQRIAIARALLLDAPVLVLDEATSSVDSHNELAIQHAISELTRGRTVLVIAHRLWTVQQADQILVMDRGRVVERGRHRDLLERGGLYRRMWDAQSQPPALRGQAPEPRPPSVEVAPRPS